MYQSPSQIPADVEFWVLNGKFCQLSDLPDYLNDLNAMHAAVQSQTPSFRSTFDSRLHDKTIMGGKLVVDLTAQDWADVFVDILNAQA